MLGFREGFERDHDLRSIARPLVKLMRCRLLPMLQRTHCLYVDKLYNKSKADNVLQVEALVRSDVVGHVFLLRKTYRSFKLYSFWTRFSRLTINNFAILPQDTRFQTPQRYQARCHSRKTSREVFPTPIPSSGPTRPLSRSL